MSVYYSSINYLSVVMIMLIILSSLAVHSLAPFIGGCYTRTTAGQQIFICRLPVRGVAAIKVVLPNSLLVSLHYIAMSYMHTRAEREEGKYSWN